MSNKSECACRNALNDSEGDIGDQWYQWRRARVSDGSAICVGPMFPSLLCFPWGLALVARARVPRHSRETMCPDFFLYKALHYCGIAQGSDRTRHFQHRTLSIRLASPQRRPQQLRYSLLAQNSTSLKALSFHICNKDVERVQASIHNRTRSVQMPSMEPAPAPWT
jgi:hypothetical protein